ncbi:hypothetical protein HK100_004820 [Physocladia obscura]|uniref:Uncharacterized protein n=1 Tax=Physocladia obscura TaxID=109957 RepID=A0AAD5T6W1_9FUNG|nr:hypothetical protein HK100_004820 [Physocladia obscura]
MSTTSVIDFAYPSQVTASSFDSVSATCLPNLCNPKESTDDGEDTGGHDNTQWQSYPAYGATCDPMSILYGNESFIFDGQAQGAVNIGPTVSITSTSGTTTNAVARTDYSFVSTTSPNNGKPTRFDTFLPISSLVEKDVKVVRFTWDNLVPQGKQQLCQINVEEVVIYGANVTTAAAESTATTAAVSNGSNAESSSNLSGGAIAGIVIVAAIVAVAGTVFGVRSRNIVKKKRLAELRESTI